jgi:hypothetical protein
MATINQLSSVDTLQGGDQIPVYDQSNGDARKASMTTLLQYIDSNITLPTGTVYSYDTVANVTVAAGLAVGDYVVTKGYNFAGDGGGASYRIVANGTGVADGGSYIYLSGSGRQAELLFTDGVVYVDQFGAIGDGVADDTAAIKAALHATFSLTSPVTIASPWKGIRKLQFGINKKYKISETLSIQGALAFLDDPDGQGNYYGCNVDVDFGGSILYPTITANPVVILWGQSAVYSNLRIDPRVYCTDQQIVENQLVGVRLCPMEFDELAGFAATYNSTYDRIIIDRSWRGFEMPEDRNFFYRCKFQFCESTSFDYGFYIDCNAYVGDGTSNAFQQCHVRAGDSKVGRSVAGVDYWCIQTHTSSAGTQPGVGADWQDYWVEVDWSTGGGTYPAWVTGTFYTGAGKGYYLRGGAIFAFTGHNSVDGCIPHRNNVGPALTIDSPAAVIISGGLHLEAHYIAKDYVPLIDIHGADVSIDQIYVVGCAFEAPTASVLIGSSPDPIVYHNSVYYQVKGKSLSHSEY